MAVSTVQPYAPAHDFVTLKEARRLFEQTGHPVSDSTIRRWDVKLTKISGVVVASWSDLLVAHGVWVTAAIP